MTHEQLVALPDVHEAPNFDNLATVFRRGIPTRPTLFELFMNEDLYRRIASGGRPELVEKWPWHKILVEAFRRAGYDYATLHLPGFGFGTKARRTKSTFSLNEGFVITDEASFKAYDWPNPDDADWDAVEKAAEFLPDGMKFVYIGPSGVEENTISLVGYENLCYMMMDEPDLAQEIFDAVGSRILRAYQQMVKYPFIGACIGNDDWGFNTQTLLSVDQIRRYVFPWHKKIVETVHAAGKPIVLHSCGCYRDIIDDVIDDLHYDARHSYEDNIVPVEQAYEDLHDRIAVIGGLDVSFVCTATPEQVYERAKAMLQRTEGRGGYALGTGNSVPPYMPHENYFAMLRAAIETRA